MRAVFRRGVLQVVFLLALLAQCFRWRVSFSSGSEIVWVCCWRARRTTTLRVRAAVLLLSVSALAGLLVRASERGRGWCSMSFREDGRERFSALWIAWARCVCVCCGARVLRRVCARCVRSFAMLGTVSVLVRGGY